MAQSQGDSVGAQQRRRAADLRRVIEDDAAVTYPEHERQREVLPKAEVIGEFLEWLESKGVSMVAWRGDEPVVWGGSITKVLADYLDINLDTLEAEKQAMLQGLRMDNRGTQEPEQ